MLRGQFLTHPRSAGRSHFGHSVVNTSARLRDESLESPNGITGNKACRSSASEKRQHLNRCSRTHFFYSIPTPCGTVRSGGFGPGAKRERVFPGLSALAQARSNASSNSKHVDLALNALSSASDHAIASKSCPRLLTSHRLCR